MKEFLINSYSDYDKKYIVSTSNMVDLVVDYIISNVKITKVLKNKKKIIVKKKYK